MLCVTSVALEHGTAHPLLYETLNAELFNAMLALDLGAHMHSLV